MRTQVTRWSVFATFWESDPFNGLADELVTAKWRDGLLNRPGEALQGVAYQKSSFQFEPADFIVQDSPHWAFTGTGLLNGDALGSLLAAGATDYVDAASPPLADVLLTALRDVPRPGNTPPVASVDAAAIYYEDSPSYGFPDGNGGQIFAGGTTHWYLGLLNDEDVRQVSRNVIERMLSTPPPTPGNQTPIVFAGLNQRITLPSTATLDGTVWDDGRPDPPAILSLTWSQESGPGTVTFSEVAASDTTASFSATGTYVLRLTADDDELSAFDEITVMVNILDVQVSSSADDAEETSTGTMELTSPDLDLGSGRTVGIRFSPVDIPHDAVIVNILNAYVQFQADKTGSPSGSMTIQGDDTGSAPAFTETSGDITSRARTTTAVSWSPPEWTAGEAGTGQRTSDMASVVEEIADRPDWSSGNAMVMIFSGTGLREAESFDGNSAAAPILHVEFSVESCGDGIKALSGMIVSDQQTFEACTTLSAGSFQILGPGGKVTFAAGEQIVLQEGFQVRVGAEFTAILDPSLLP